MAARSNRSAPVRVSSLTEVTRIAAGASHSCALRSSGRVFCWGWNGNGELGDGTTTSRLTPVAPVRVRDLTGATGVAAGRLHSCAVRSAGRVFCWGGNTSGQLGNGTTTAGGETLPVRVIGLTGAQQVTAGGYHSCGLDDGGQAYCWGANGSGQLGDGTTTDRWTAVRVAN